MRIWLLVVMIGFAPAAPARAETISKPPNVIFILADDLGWGDLGCYGNKSIRTPNLDRMAGEGIRFTQNYAGSTVCTPSRAVFFTGVHTGHAYQRENEEKNIRQRDVTIAEVLKSGGYSTGLVGKWGLAAPHTDGAPTKKGFDSFYGYYGNNPAHNYYPAFLWRNDQRESLPNEVIESKNGSGVATKKVRYSNDAFSDEASVFIEQHAKAGPFFLCLAFTIPHANNEAAAATGNGMEVPDLGEYASRADWPEVRKCHAAMISRLDGYVGRILDQLKKLGIDDQTIVFFSSDNGGHAEGGYDPKMNQSNGPLRGHKTDLYDGGIRVPLIARWPGTIKGGQISDEIVWFADVMPTLAELASVDKSKLPAKVDGLSIVPTLLGRADRQSHHEFLYWEFYEQGTKQAVRADEWKAIRAPMFEGKTELYDLRTDISESKDVAAEHPDVVKMLERHMQAAHTPPEANEN